MSDPRPDYEAHLRVPPHSMEAEQSVLGALLLDNSAWDRVVDLLDITDFYRHEHRLIYDAIGYLILADKEADVITVHERLAGKRHEVGGMQYLNALAQSIPSAANIRRYAEIVRDCSVRRKLVATSDSISSAAFDDGKDVGALLDWAEQSIGTVRRDGGRASGDDWEALDTGLVRTIDRISALHLGEEKPDFIPTGLAELDERLDGGLRPGELIILAARSSMGKTAMALTISRNVALDEELPVGIFSMEMPRAQIHNRLLSIESRIHLSRLRRPERLRDYDWSALSDATSKLTKAAIDINDQPNLDISQVRSKARALHRKRGKLGLIVVDYLGLMAGTDPRMLRAYQLAEVTVGLKGLAKELGCPIVLLQQVKREADARSDPMPQVADLKDSGSPEQDADVIVFVHRPIQHTKTLADEWKYYARASVAKLRDGEPGELNLMYVGENTRFADWPKETPIPTSKTRVKQDDRPL